MAEIENEKIEKAVIATMIIVFVILILAMILLPEIEPIRCDCQEIFISLSQCLESPYHKCYRECCGHGKLDGYEIKEKTSVLSYRHTTTPPPQKETPRGEVKIIKSQGW